MPTIIVSSGTPPTPLLSPIDRGLILADIPLQRKSTGQAKNLLKISELEREPATIPAPLVVSQPDILNPAGIIHFPSTAEIPADIIWLGWEVPVTPPLFWVVWVGSSVNSKEYYEVILDESVIPRSADNTLYVKVEIPLQGVNVTRTVTLLAKDTAESSPAIVDFKTFNIATKVAFHPSTVLEISAEIAKPFDAPFLDITAYDEVTHTPLFEQPFTYQVPADPAFEGPTKTYAATIDSGEIPVTVSYFDWVLTIALSATNPLYDRVLVKYDHDAWKGNLAPDFTGITRNPTSDTYDIAWQSPEGASASQVTNFLVTITQSASGNLVSQTLVSPNAADATGTIQQTATLSVLLGGGEHTVTVTANKSGTSPASVTATFTPTLAEGAFVYDSPTAGYFVLPRLTRQGTYRLVVTDGVTEYLDVVHTVIPDSPEGIHTLIPVNLQLPESTLPVGLSSPLTATVTLHYVAENLDTEHNFSIITPPATLALPHTGTYINGERQPDILCASFKVTWQALNASSYTGAVIRVTGFQDSAFPLAATEHWVLDITDGGNITVTLLGKKPDNTLTVLDTVTLKVGSSLTRITSPTEIILTPDTLFTWSGIPLSGDLSVTAVSPPYTPVVTKSVSPEANQDLLQAIPDSPNPARVWFTSLVNGILQGATRILENNRTFVGITIPLNHFSATTQQLSWTVSDAPTIVNLQVLVTPHGNSSVHYYDSGLLPGAARLVIAEGLPDLGERVDIVLKFKKDNGVWFTKTYPRDAFDRNNPLPAIVNPVPALLPGIPFTAVASPFSYYDVSTWRVTFGTVPQGSDVYDSGVVPVTTTDFQIPAQVSGGNIFSTLFFTDTNNVSDVTERVFSTVFLPPKITAPACVPDQATPLQSSSYLVTWDSMGVADATTWRLQAFLGSQGQGTAFYDSGSLQGSIRQETVTSIGVQGRDITFLLSYQSPTYGAGSLFVACKEFDLTPVWVSPTPDSTLTLSPVQVSWQDVPLVVAWRARVTAFGDAQEVLHVSAVLSAGTTSYSIPLTLDGARISISLEYSFDGIAFRAVSENFYTRSDPTITLPEPSVILASLEKIYWRNNGTVVTQYQIAATSPDGNTVYAASGSLPAGILATIVSPLPQDGRDVRVTLSYTTANTTGTDNVTYTSQRILPEIIPLNPPYTGLRTITWTQGGLSVAGWEIKVGSTAGGDDILPATALPAATLQQNVTLPDSLGTAYYTLTFTDDVVVGDTVTYEHPLQTHAKILSPTLGSTLTALPQIVLQPSSDPVVALYRLKVGTVAGASDISSTTINADNFQNTLALPPLSGGSQTLFFTLEASRNGTWSVEDSGEVSIASNPIILTDIVDPITGRITQQLTHTEYTFDWSLNGTPATQVMLTVGHDQGGTDIFSTGPLPSTTTSATVSNLPITGEVIYVTLVILN